MDIIPELGLHLRVETIENDTTHHLGKSTNDELKNRPQEEGKWYSGRRHSAKGNSTVHEKKTSSVSIRCPGGVSNEGNHKGPKRGV